jgi:hypothetical protein
MLPADTIQRPKARVTGPARKALILLTLCLTFTPCAPSLAQSGLAQAPASAGSAQPGSVRPRQVKRERELPTSFIVVSAPPDGSQETSPYVPPGYADTLEPEELVRGGCLVELRNLPGVKVIEDVDVARWEARETALGEDEAWVIWLELKWNQSITRDAIPFKLRYLLFEPRTGKIVSSGYGRGIRQTWGRPRPRTDIREQLREAGRDIADQVVSELRRTP